MHYTLPFLNFSLDKLNEYSFYTEWHVNSQYFALAPGVEHYWVVSELARKLPPGTKVLDVGTYLGFSALAFSTNENIHVYTVDLVDEIQDNFIKQKKNITFLYEDILQSLPKYIHCPIIMLDTNHEGPFEVAFVKRLEELNFKGILICDDIHLNEAMRNFWKNIQQRKQDITHIGHWSGTGVIFFNDDDELLIQ